MEIFKGETGLDMTWQEKFPSTTECVHCKARARIAFVAKEEEEDEWICNLHNNKEHSRWLHDAGAFAIYLCCECLKPTTLYNQA